MVTTKIYVESLDKNDDVHQQDLPMSKLNEAFEEEAVEITESSPSSEQNGREKKSANSRIIGNVKLARERYTSSFTLHALNHIIEGSLPEKILWTLKLLAAFGVAIYLCWNLFKAYFQHDVNSKIEVVSKRSMQLPAVYICRKNCYKYLNSYNDCTSNTSKSYDVDICTSIRQQCPSFFEMSHYNGVIKPNCTQRRTGPANVSCGPGLLGQCISINADGKSTQTILNSGMSYWDCLNTSMLGLQMYILPTGSSGLEGEQIYFKEIDKFGYYSFTIEKTRISRLPYPYSTSPPCIEQGSNAAKEKNMFIGPYTFSRCKKTCLAKLELMCGKTTNLHRVLAHDPLALKEQLQDNNMSQFWNCSNTKWNTGENEAILNECILKCFPSCAEERYHVHVSYQAIAEKQIYMSFAFKSLEETSIVETPSFDISTLLANFGGTLGLMTGMSAISIIELVLWMILFLIDRGHLVFDKMRMVCNKLTSSGAEQQDSMV